MVRTLRNLTVDGFKEEMMTFYSSYHRMTGKEIKKMITVRRIDNERGKIRNQSFTPDFNQSFNVRRKIMKSRRSQVRKKRDNAK